MRFKIINFYEKNITFATYDYAYSNGAFLEDYNIEKINIKHFSKKIIIKFEIEFLIPAIGILVNKIENITETNPLKSSVLINLNYNTIELSKIDTEGIFEICANSKSSIIPFVIQSPDYDLLQKKA